MESKKTNGLLAAVRVRGESGIKRRLKETLDKLKLHKKNFCVVVSNNPSYVGMLKKVNSYITWGETNQETFEMLVEKRGEEFSGREADAKNKIKRKKFFFHNGKKIKKFFRLNSPKKGFGRKGIKIPFSKGGALGYRGEKINDLIKRMV